MQNFVSSGELPLEVLQKGLDSFKNTKDRDIEFFLREKALDFEKDIGVLRIYLLTRIL